MRTGFAVILAIAISGSGVCAQKKKDDPQQIGNRDVGKGLNVYSIDREIALGRQLAQEVRRQAKILDDPIVTEYVNRLGQNLVRNSDAKVPFTFEVIDDDTPNAFALPGGFVFVHTGLIKIASEEDELAGAMAHEIAHVAARHMTRQATRTELANAFSIPLVLLGGGWVRQGANVALPPALLSFTRAAEAEADYLGVQYMYSAGYDPNGAVSILEKLESLERRKQSMLARVFLATHPLEADRIDKTQKEIQRILPSRSEYIVNTSDYMDVRERVIRKGEERRAKPAEQRPSLIRRAPQE
jgi:beta-barrel assembly-enhancing protease